ncbi:metal-dependent transcriptional regulator [Caldisericum exile]|uniref:Transcriptional regulator n=1 Tax=Caldisericum exile (strain DSM 21853 / NBRC 104410 / AZM16c01) TaxID=511051 RepID=A0A7U6JFT2_CALEA|nr:metal-dependent transcriptional regulator [Caldisericum exile]BAL80570.1 putative transcriptional regulator [Caldisericum exile AZM16c01]
MEFSLSESLEDYLVDLLELSQRDCIVRLVDLARKRKVTLPSALEAVKTLAEKNFLVHKARGYIVLTDYGLEQARKIYEKKKILLSFLVDVLGVKPEIAIRDAHKIEHDISNETFDAIVKFVKTTHLNKEGKEEKMPLTLADLKVGESGKIVSIKDEAGKLKSKLLSMGATSGTVVKVKRLAPLGDPIEVLILDYHLSLRKSEAEQILVERI